MSSTKRPDTVLVLADGRRLGYAEFGDPSGAPCLYFHFSPGSRLEPAAVFSGVRQPWLQGVRLVSADRPGFGLSDRPTARTLLDWPGDIAALADHLGIDRFAVLGASGGGAYALACARLLPSRLTAAVVVSGMGPLDRPGATTGMAFTNRLLYGLGRRARIAPVTCANDGPVDTAATRSVPMECGLDVDQPLSLSAMGPGRRGCPLALFYATDEQAGGVDLRAADEAAGGRSGVLAGCYLRAK